MFAAQLSTQAFPKAPHNTAVSAVGQLRARNTLTVNDALSLLLDKLATHTLGFQQC